LQILAIIALRERRTIVARNVDLIQRNIKLAEDFFTRQVSRKTVARS
jgi:hypothetical protein